MEEFITIENFINGSFIKAKNFIENIDPATGKVFGYIQNSDNDDVNQAVEAAKSAFHMWSQTPVKERATILLKIADILKSRLTEFAEAESRDQGKPVSLAASVDIPRAIHNFEHFAMTVQCDLDMAVAPPNEGVVNYTVRTPVGVVAIITPWNLPLYLLSFKLAPALAYGNTVVIKPSEHTSVTAWMLCQVLKEAGVPNGVVNMVFGLGNPAGEHLVTHPEVSLISFTGSTLTGTRIAEKTAKASKKLSLEMGGKNAAIVFEDADLEKSVTELIKASFLNSGQVCLASSRIYVQKSIYDKFLEKFVQAAKALNVGPPISPASWMGPINNKMQYNKILKYLDLARESGVIFELGDTTKLNLPPENKDGYFIPPYILTGAKEDSVLMQEEIFGPVTCVAPFDTEEEVIFRANNVQYGLCAALFSQNVSRVLRVAPKLEVGTIWCNCWLVRNLHLPFGGTKMSGVGREGTHASREFYTEIKTICIRI